MSTRGRDAWPLLVLALAIVARLWQLDADPYVYGWAGFVTDEARWVETARNLALFHDPNLYGLSRLHLLLSPLYQGACFVAFKLFGVDFWQARLVTAVSSIALMALTTFVLRSALPSTLLTALLMAIGFGPEFLGLGRIAVPEIPALLGLAASLYCICSGQWSVRRAILAGLLALIAVGCKGTVGLALPGLIAASYLANRIVPVAQRLSGTLAFVATLASPALLAVPALMGHDGAQPALSDSINLLLGYLEKLQPTGPIWFLFERMGGQASVVVHLGLLGCWLAAIGGMARRPNESEIACRLRTGSLVVGLGTFLAMTLLDYSPPRYFVHVQFFLLVSAALGIATLRAADFSRPVSVGHALLVGAPAALLGAQLLSAAFAAVHLPIEHLQSRLLICIAATAGAWVLLRWIKPAASSRRAICLAALLVLLCEAVALHLGWVDSFWPTRDADLSPLLATIAAGLALAAAARRGAMHDIRLPIALAAMIVFAALAGTLRPVLQPSFSIRETAGDVATDLRGSQRIWVRKAATIMLPTKLRYRESSQFERPIEAIVALECSNKACDVHFEQAEAQGLRESARYALQISGRDDRRGIDVRVFLKPSP
ncbi:MAG: hypothetical protein R3E77_11175 [Steroidobacteraceae bacterium]